MRLNGIIDHDIVTDLVTEPVTLAEVKRHLNLLFDTDGAYEFGDDDALLTSLITISRKYLENYTGVSFGSKTITAQLRNELGGVELPLGPITAVTSIKDDKGVTLTADQYKIQGLKFPRILWPYYRFLEVTYTAGYATIPEDLKRAILEDIAFRYNHRGDEISHANV